MKCKYCGGANSLAMETEPMPVKDDLGNDVVPAQVENVSRMRCSACNQYTEWFAHADRNDAIMAWDIGAFVT